VGHDVLEPASAVAVAVAIAQVARHERSERYARLARNVAFVGALARDMGVEPAPGVRGSALDADDSLRGEWDVVVLGPHFAARVDSGK